MPLSSLEIDGNNPVEERAIFTSGQWGYYSPGASNLQLNDVGLLNGLNYVETTFGRGEDSTGFFFQQNTAFSVDSDAYIRFPNQGIRLDTLPLFVCKFRMSHVTNIRFVSILSVAVNALLSDTISFAETIGIQYSTSRGDANYQFISNDGATQTLIDSGIPADTNSHYLQVNATASDNVTVRLLDENFVEEAATTFTNVNPVLPPATSLLGNFCGVRALAADLRSIANYHGSLLLKNS